MTPQQPQPRPVIVRADNTALVTLTRGQVAIIDACDAELVGAHNWHAAYSVNGFYGRRYVHDASRRWHQRAVYLHKFILGIEDGHVDHRSRDTLDCRRLNLRPCTVSQNAANRRRRRGRFPTGVSPFRGGRFIATICVDRALRHLGVFDTQDAASRAYELAAVELRGEFAIRDEISLAALAE